MNDDWKKRLDEIMFDVDCSDGETKRVTKILLSFIQQEKEKSYEEGKRKVLKLIKDLERDSGEACSVSEGLQESACEEASMWQQVGKELKSILSTDIKE